MTADREQIQLDIAGRYDLPSQHCRALLAELEQTEKERDDLFEQRTILVRSLNNAVGLVKVVRVILDERLLHPVTENELREALTEWERE